MRPVDWVRDVVDDDVVCGLVVPISVFWARSWAAGLPTYRAPPPPLSKPESFLPTMLSIIFIFFLKAGVSLDDEVVAMGAALPSSPPSPLILVGASTSLPDDVNLPVTGLLTPPLPDSEVLGRFAPTIDWLYAILMLVCLSRGRLVGNLGGGMIWWLVVARIDPPTGTTSS